MIGKEKQRLVAIREGKVLLNSAGMLPAADDVRVSAPARCSATATVRLITPTMLRRQAVCG